MADVAVITAQYGRYDVIKPVVPQTGAGVEWVLVTDDETLPDGHLGWRVVYEPQPGIPPMRAAKRPKLRPWLYTDALASIWIDGSYRILSDRFVTGVMAYADPLAQFPQSDRDCVYDEAAVSPGIPKYAGEPIAAQAAHYRELGHPAHWGLWCTSAIARIHTPEVIAMGEAWQAEVDRWSTQDQVSQPYVLRHAGLRPALLPGGYPGMPAYRASAWLRLEASGKHT